MPGTETNYEKMVCHLSPLPFQSHAFPLFAREIIEKTGISMYDGIESSAQLDENGMCTGFDGEYRVKNVTIGGEPLDPDKIYTVASNQYVLVEHGDGMTAFDGCKVVQDQVKIDNQVLIDYLTETLDGVVSEKYADPYGEGRITIIEKPEEAAGSAAEEAVSAAEETGSAAEEAGSSAAEAA